jgi:hypothetical protein
MKKEILLVNRGMRGLPGQLLLAVFAFLSASSLQAQSLNKLSNL